MKTLSNLSAATKKVTKTYERSMRNPVTAVGDVGTEQLLTKLEPEFEAKTSDLFSKTNRRVMRTLTGGDYVMPLEMEQRPDSLKKETRQNERHSRLLRTVRQRSID